MFSCKLLTMMPLPESWQETHRAHGVVVEQFPAWQCSTKRQVNNPGARIRPRGLKEALKACHGCHSEQIELIEFGSLVYSVSLEGGGGGGRAAPKFKATYSFCAQAAEEALELHRKLGDRNGEAHPGLGA